MKSGIWWLMGLGLVLSLAGCASAPEAELGAAQMAVDQAKGAEADVYAAADFQSLNQLLDEAKAEIQVQNEKFALMRDYESAKAKLAEVSSKAASVLETAAANKEQMKMDTEAGMAEAAQALEAAAQALATAPKGKGTQADLAALQADLDAARQALGQAQASYDGGKYAEALNQVNAVKSQVASVAEDIANAVAKKGR